MRSPWVLLLAASVGPGWGCGFPTYAVADGAGGGGSAGVSGSASIAFVETAGQVSIEAEHFSDSAPGRFEVAAIGWTIPTECPAGASGGCVWASPDSGTLLNDQSYGARLDYRLRFETSGIYYVWLRSFGPSDMSNSVHLGFDGRLPFTYGSLGVTVPPGTWAWVNSLDATHPTPLQLSVDSRGEHTLALYIREDGSYVDKFLLTTDATLIPTDAGPLENARE